MNSAQSSSIFAQTSRHSGIFPNINGDIFFIAGIAAIAIISGLFVSFFPDYFFAVLTLDLWLLGYHHVISTYTRIGSDLVSIKQHWLLLLPLPIMVFTAVYTVYQLGGTVLLGSMYLYWQWYHYTRQSEGIAKAYGAKCTDKLFSREPVNRLLFYIVPLCSFTYMISAGPTHFLTIPIFSFTLVPPLRWLLAIICVTAAAVWLIKAFSALKKKQISAMYFGYTLSHFCIYLVAYVVISEINHCWLTINIWHNAQYIGFVWLFNRKRFAQGIVKQHLIISYISQPNRLFIYLGSCLILSITIYWLVDIAIWQFSMNNSLMMFFIVYSAINFHHYIVDSQIWKLRKPQIQNTIIH